ncbi:hypothetical protein R5M92_03450 [Halomonas sp. Bachu 37]|uniref:hypothetical protein n=1 Tax=Halomonas kashgarensis TaxID=3084920 RepID=UPI003216E185
MIRTPTLLIATLCAPLLAVPLHAAADTLSLPADAKFGVEVVEQHTIDASNRELNEILLHPAMASGSTHELPEYCVLTADARLESDRVRISVDTITCIEAHDSDSAIFSDAISAAAYDAEGSYGIPCEGGECTLAPGESFMLHLAEEVSIEEQENPSAQINAERRQANGEGVANPIPGERPDPEDTPVINEEEENKDR